MRHHLLRSSRALGILVAVAAVAVTMTGGPAAFAVAATARPLVVSAPSMAGAVVSVKPARIADSRRKQQIPGAVPAGATVTVQVTGRGGVPASGVSAVVLNVTAVAPEKAGYITVWASWINRTATSNLNFQARQNIPNTVIVRVGPDGKIQLLNGSSGSVQLIVDITGYTLTGGAVWGWGGGRYGAFGNGGTADSPLPVQATRLNNVTAIAAGLFTGYALRGDGTVWAWGSGYSGQLGNGGTADSPLPVQVSGLTNVTAIASGTYTGYALRRDGTAWAWGRGLEGQLGNGGTANSPLPVQVSGLTNVTAIAGGSYTGCW